jgi:hypothetical protein
LNFLGFCFPPPPISHYPLNKFIVAPAARRYNIWKMGYRFHRFLVIRMPMYGLAQPEQNIIIRSGWELLTPTAHVWIPMFTLENAAISTNVTVKF